MLRMMEGFPPSHQLKKFNKTRPFRVNHVNVNILIYYIWFFRLCLLGFILIYYVWPWYVVSTWVILCLARVYLEAVVPSQAYTHFPTSSSPHHRTYHSKALLFISKQYLTCVISFKSRRANLQRPSGTMTKKSELPAPNKRVSVLLNHQLRRENATIRPRLDAIEAAGNEFKADIRALKEGVEDTLPAQLQVLDSGFKAADEKREAEIQTLREEAKTAVDHAQGLARDLKAADEKHRVEIRMLTEGMEVVKRNFDEISERVKALEKAKQDTGELLSVP